MPDRFDFAVIGGGIAGASAAYRLAPHGKTVLLETESQPGYHTTGRSAALYSRRYKNPLIRGLAAASGSFLEHPPDGFTTVPLLHDRGLLIVGRPDQRAAVEAQFTPDQIADGVAEEISTDDACKLVPPLKADYLGATMLVPDARDIDVDALHRGFLRGFTANGGSIRTDAEAHALSRSGGVWRIELKSDVVEAPVVINAAGAWADTVAERAGLRPLGIDPLRRTCATFDPPEGLDPTRWPMVMDAEEAFYFKPEAGRILTSPCDETAMPASDVQADELDVAIAVDRVETATTLSVRRITHRWAGLRCFFRDRMPVAGKDPEAPGFIWLAGLGGFGIMTSEALGRAAATAAISASLDTDLISAGVEPAALSPTRLAS